MKYQTGNQQLDVLRAFARHETYGGYVWAAVTRDGELLCEGCVLANYRRHFRATQNDERNNLNIAGLDNSGEHDELEHCARCNKALWGAP
jgi:hypothetical protein